MKRLFLILLGLLALCLSTKSFAKQEPKIVVIKTHGNASGYNRDLEEPPIACYVDEDLGCFIVYFSGDLGLVDIEIENSTTSEYINTVVSGVNYAIIPFSASYGVWTISIIPSTNIEYYGEYEIY